MYSLHPSNVLKQAFSRTPYQGMEPELARFLFIGLDANYDANIEQSAIFAKLLHYLNDGVEFWKTHGIHHPFLLPEYRRRDGWKYHRTFSTIGFQPCHASQISFIELLHVPTCGRSQLKSDELDNGHLARINHAILHGDAEYIFISDSVARLMRCHSFFDWMPPQPERCEDGLKLWHRAGKKKIFSHYHFSVYGKFESLKQAQLRAISQLI